MAFLDERKLGELTIAWHALVGRVMANQLDADEVLQRIRALGCTEVPVRGGAEVWRPGERFDWIRFRAYARAELTGVIALKLPSLGKSGLQMMVDEFWEAVKGSAAFDQWRTAITQYFLEPLGAGLMEDCESYVVRVAPGAKPPRRGYEHLYQAVKIILDALADALGQSRLIMPELDVPEDPAQHELAFGGTARARMARQDVGGNFVYWTCAPGLQDAEGGVLKRAAIVRW